MFTEVILVNWKRAVDTCICIDSLLAIKDAPIYIVVCDNCSPDGSGEELQLFLKGRFGIGEKRDAGRVSVFDYYRESDRLRSCGPVVTLVLNNENSGFARGNNVALAFASSDIPAKYFWFLNNDTEVEPDALGIMIARMREDEKIGICGSMLVYDHDRFTVQAHGGAQYYRWTGAVREIGNRSKRDIAVDRDAVEKTLSYVSGASMLVSKQFLETVGRLSEDYFLYYEEIDWAVRARRAGYRLGYAPEAVVYHKEGAALGSGKSEGRSLLAEYFGVRNRIVFTRKFFPWALPSVFCFTLLQVLRRCTQGRWAHAGLMLAVLFGLRKVPPK